MYKSVLNILFTISESDEQLLHTFNRKVLRAVNKKKCPKKDQFTGDSDILKSLN